jgi:hypothetical protein
MVLEHIQFALVIEDDADWDVLLKAQMTEFARGTRFLRMPRCLCTLRTVTTGTL